MLNCVFVSKKTCKAVIIVPCDQWLQSISQCLHNNNVINNNNMRLWKISCTPDNAVKKICINTDAQKWLKMLYYACEASRWRCNFENKHFTLLHISILLQRNKKITKMAKALSSLVKTRTTRLVYYYTGPLRHQNFVNFVGKALIIPVGCHECFFVLTYIDWKNTSA